MPLFYTHNYAQKLKISIAEYCIAIIEILILYLSTILANVYNVSSSSFDNKYKALYLLSAQISTFAENFSQTSGLREEAKIRHRLSWLNCTQRTPAGFPSGIPGMAEEIDGAMQQAPQPGRQVIFSVMNNYMMLLHQSRNIFSIKLSDWQTQISRFQISFL